MKRLSLRQSLALWTLIPMVTFSLIVLALSSAWAWRDVRGVAEERNASLVGLAASTLADHDANVEDLCVRLVELSPWVRGALYVVERSSGRILCAPPDARLSAGDSAGYDLAPQADTGGTLSPSSLSDRRHTVSYAPVPGTSWAVILEEPRPTWSLRPIPFSSPSLP